MLPFGSIFSRFNDSNLSNNSTEPADMNLRFGDQKNAGTHPTAIGAATPNPQPSPRSGVFSVSRPSSDQNIQRNIRSKSRRVLAIELEKETRERGTAMDKLQKSRQTTEKLLAEHNELLRKNRELEKDRDTFITKCQKLEHGQKELERKHQFVYGRYNFIVKHLLRPYASSNNTRYNEENADSILATIRPLLHEATTSAINKAASEALEARVLSLQQQLLCNVEKIDSVPDDTFATEFRQLAKAIKNFSRNIQLTDSNALIRIDAIRQSLLVGRVKPEDLISTIRTRPVVEAFVWSVLYSHIFCSPFYMFESFGLADGFTDVFGGDHQHQWPSPTTSAEQWRLISIEQLVRRVGEETITTGIMQGKSPQLEANIQRVRSKVKDTIVRYLVQASPGMSFSRVDNIVDKAFSLALHIFLQRCRMQVVYPQVGDTYEKDQSHLDSIAESIEVEKGRVALIACPGLTKWGDGEGKHLDQRLDLVPAMVLAEPMATKNDNEVFQAEQLANTKDTSSGPIAPHTRKTNHPRVVIPAKPKSECAMIKIEDTELADDVL